MGSLVVMEPQRIISRLCISPELQSILASFSLLFCFLGHFIVLVQFHISQQQTSSDKPDIHNLHSTERHTGQFSNEQVNMEKHLAAKEPRPVFLVEEEAQLRW